MRRPDTWGQKQWLDRPVVKAWIILHFSSMTNRELAAALNVGLASLRPCVHGMGLFRMELEYWPNEAIADLWTLYPTVGDLEMAGIFQERYPKKKGWTKKHIEKKRKYLGIKRTPAMLESIHCKYLGKPVDTNRTHVFKTLGVVGEVRNFNHRDSRPMAHMKCADGAWRPYAPIVWKQHHGPIPAGYRVTYIDRDRTNCSLENLRLVRHVDVPRIYGSGDRKLTDKWVAFTLTYRQTPEERAAFLQQPALLELRRNQLRLSRLIKNSTQL